MVRPKRMSVQPVESDANMNSLGEKDKVSRPELGADHYDSCYIHARLCFEDNCGEYNTEKVTKVLVSFWSKDRHGPQHPSTQHSIFQFPL